MFSHIKEEKMQDLYQRQNKALQCMATLAKSDRPLEARRESMWQTTFQTMDVTIPHSLAAHRVMQNEEVSALLRPHWNPHLLRDWNVGPNDEALFEVLWSRWIDASRDAERIQLAEQNTLSVPTYPGQCIRTSHGGERRCGRRADPNSSLCWQHK